METKVLKQLNHSTGVLQQDQMACFFTKNGIYSHTNEIKTQYIVDGRNSHPYRADLLFPRSTIAGWGQWTYNNRY